MTVSEMTMKQSLLKITLFLMGIQAVVFYGHWVLYHTIIFAFMPSPAVSRILWITILLLSFSFVTFQILVNKWNFRVLNALYTGAALWIGTMHFLIMASFVFWGIAMAIVPLGALPPWPVIGSVLFGIALFLSAYAATRSFRPGYIRYYIKIAGLPKEWRGRKAAVVSDVHLGGIRGVKSSENIARMINEEGVDIVFMPGDLFDGPPADYTRLAAPLSNIKARLGVYFTEGNHEEFGDPAPFLDAIRAAGIKILNKEMVVIDGLQILGLPYENSNHSDEVQASLAAIPFDPEKPSILLKHAPSSVRAVATSGISLMLSGHTHNAQMWPYSFFIRRLFGRAGYGYSESNNMQVITTSGYGTWGPPQRIGTRSEVVIIKFS